MYISIELFVNLMSNTDKNRPRALSSASVLCISSSLLPLIALPALIALLALTSLLVVRAFLPLILPLVAVLTLVLYFLCVTSSIASIVSENSKVSTF